MTTLEWMDIIYPLTASLLVGYIIAKLLFYFLVRKTIVVLFDVVLLTAEAAILIILALSTGKSPPFNIDEYRVFVAWARGIMGVVLAFCIAGTLLAIYRSIRSNEHGQTDTTG